MSRHKLIQFALILSLVVTVGGCVSTGSVSTEVPKLTAIPSSPRCGGQVLGLIDYPSRYRGSSLQSIFLVIGPTFDTVFSAQLQILPETGESEFCVSSELLGSVAILLNYGYEICQGFVHQFSLSGPREGVSVFKKSEDFESNRYRCKPS